MSSGRDNSNIQNASRQIGCERNLSRDDVTQERFEAALDQLKTWYDEWKPRPEREAARYVICVGLAVLHRMREGWPISRQHYISGLDVRTSGPLIRNILARYGIHRMYASAGGRTCGGAILAAEALVSRMNPLAEGWSLDVQERGEIIDGLQTWLIEKVELYFSAHPVPASPARSGYKRSSG